MLVADLRGKGINEALAILKFSRRKRGGCISHRPAEVGCRECGIRKARSTRHALREASRSGQWTDRSSVSVLAQWVVHSRIIKKTSHIFRQLGGKVIIDGSETHPIGFRLGVITLGFRVGSPKRNYAGFFARRH